MYRLIVGLKTLLLMALALTLIACMPAREFDATIKTAANVNPNHEGRPSPVVVLLYELKGEKIFENADFFSLYNNGKQVLGADYISQQELELIPDRTATVHFPLSEEAEYIGVVAAFSNLEQTTWRAMAPIDSSWGESSFTISLDKKGIAIGQ